jgi:hypothetical protein
MSDPVTGEIGGQPVFLENAATEATLKQLVTAIALLSANQKKTKGGLPGQKEVETQLKKFLEDLKKQEKSTKKLLKDEDKKTSSVKKNTEATDDNTKSKKDNTRYTYMAGAGLRLLHQTTVGVVLGINNIIRDLANMGDSATSAASIFSNIPIVGSVLAGVFGSAAASAENVYRSFNTAASVGANFSGSMTQMVMSASQAGLTFDQFAGIIAKNGESLALLAEGAGEGAKRLGQLGREIRRSGIADQLYRLGFSTEEINNGMAQFAGRLARGGALQNMTTEQVAEVTGRYLRDLDAVAKLTGKSKESLQAQEDARMRDAQYLTFRNKLDAEGQKNLEILMKTIPEGMQEGAKEVLATGTATTQAGRDFLAFMNQSGRSLSDLNRVARQSGTITEQQMRSVAAGMQAEGKALAKSPLGETVGLFVKDLNDLVVAANQYAARQTDINKVITKQRNELKNNPPGLDPADMAKLKQDIANISNEFSLFLVNSGLLNQMIDLLKNELLPFISNTLVPAFRLIPGVIEDYVKPAFRAVNTIIMEGLLPAFEYLRDNFTKIATTVGLVIGALAGLKIAIMAFQTKLVLRDMAKGVLGSTPANPMWVKEVTGRPGAVGGADADKKGDKKGGGRGGAGAGKPGLIRGGLGALGVILSGIYLASEVSDINAAEKAGEITEQQADKEKAQAYGGTAGGVAGGLGGMYGGAAVGTAIFPGVGTVIGGLLGGALGAWLGGKGGVAIADAVTGSTDEAIKSNIVPNNKPTDLAAAAVDAKMKKVTKADILAHPAYTRVFEETLERNKNLINEGRLAQQDIEAKAHEEAIKAATAEMRKELASQTTVPGAVGTTPGVSVPKPESAGGTRSTGSRSNAGNRPATAIAPSSPGAGMTSSKAELESAMVESKKAQEAAQELKRAQAEEERKARGAQTANTGRPQTPQEKLDSLVASLNTSIDTLVGLNIRTNSILADQLTVQKRFQNGNLLRG